MQYHSLQHWTSLLPTDTSTTECHFHFGPAASFFLELLAVALYSSPVAYWIPSNMDEPSNWRAHLPVSYIFAFSYCSRGSHSKNTGVVYHCLLQWTMFCQNSPLSWVALHGMAHSFIELHKPLHQDKAVIHEGGKGMRIQLFKLSQAVALLLFSLPE